MVAVQATATCTTAAAPPAPLIIGRPAKSQAKVLAGATNRIEYVHISHIHTLSPLPEVRKRADNTFNLHSIAIYKLAC